MLHPILDRSLSAAGLAVVSRVRQTVAQQLTSHLCQAAASDGNDALQDADSAFPACLPQVAQTISSGEFSVAERLLQGEIRRLTSCVPPQSPQIRDWLILTSMALLQDDSVSAAAFLQQAERRRAQPGAAVSQHRKLSLTFEQQLLAVLVKSVAGHTAQASAMLDQAEQLVNGSVAAYRMWLILQLRAGLALQGAEYRSAWQAWQAAMLLRGRFEQTFRGQQDVAAADRNWVADMASRELAVMHN